MIIFPHIPKTGGTTFVNYVSSKLKSDEVLILDYEKLRIGPDSGKIYDYKKVVDKYFLGLTKEEKDKIKFLTGHAVPYGIHKHFSQSAKYITFLRDPIERTVSLYNYFRGLREKEKFWAKNKKLYRDILLVNRKVPDLSAWLKYRFGDISRPFSLGTQSDYLKVLGYTIDKFDYIGITVDLRVFPRENVSKNFAGKPNEAEITLLTKKLKKDFVMYNKVCGLQKRHSLRDFLGRGFAGE